MLRTFGIGAGDIIAPPIDPSPPKPDDEHLVLPCIDNRPLCHQHHR
ncbi:MAG: hypothetical protein U5N86_12220 [Planctomycetota bacterium]|nr:hypothetical protein [Planctomycetota bacterium]